MPTLDTRPKRYPPHEFPPRRPALFGRTPPAIFSPILGLVGLALAVQVALSTLELPEAPGQFLAGIVVPLWAFTVLAYAVKVVRRPGVVMEDLRVLPGRAGLAAMAMGGMASASLIAPLAPRMAAALVVLALTVHAIIGLCLIRILVSLPPPGREVNPTWHLSFVGFIVAAPSAVALGWSGLAEGLFWLSMPVAVAIWILSALQFLRGVPPAPLRPFLTIHLVPAGLLAYVAALLGLADMALGFLALGTLFAASLLLAGRWIIVSGVTPLWGSFTFPLAALATAMLAQGGGWRIPGLVLLLAAAIAIPVIAWWVLKRWPGGRLAQVSNAAEA
ncbi:MAG: tellurium resistance protein [Rhodobacter sp.]|nr:tellurium resistance protein [Rhodobacter sp.]